jgi:hypothetical protein
VPSNFRQGRNFGDFYARYGFFLKFPGSFVYGVSNKNTMPVYGKRPKRGREGGNADASSAGQ